MNCYLRSNEKSPIAKAMGIAMPISLGVMAFLTFIKFIFNAIVNKIYFTGDNGAITKIFIPFVTKGYLADPGSFRTDEFLNTGIKFKPFYLIECFTYSLYEVVTPLLLILALVLIIVSLTRKGGIANTYRLMKVSNTVLLFNSLMTLVFCVVFAFGLLSLSVAKGFSATRILDMFTYLGIQNLYIEGLFQGMATKMVSSIPFRVFIVCLAEVLVLGVGIAQFVCYRIVCNHHASVLDVLSGKQSVEAKKLPVIITFVVAGLSAFMGIVMIVNLTFVSALINLAIAAYFVFQGLFSMSIGKKA
jgi:hypothetical protein